MKHHEYKYSFKNQFRTMASMSVYRTGYQQCSGGYTRGPEIRDFYLIHFVISGKGTYLLNNKRFAVHTGDAFLIYPNMPINYRADQYDPWEFCWVGFNGADARILMDASGFTPEKPLITSRSPDKMHKLMMDIYECRGQETHELIAMTARLYNFLAYLIENATKNNLALKARAGSAHVQHACDYIATNYTRKISVMDIASHVNLSRSRLYRVFMQHIALSPLQYLREFRIRQACNFMHQGQDSIKEIAYAVGFDNPLYFSALFRRLTGKTPSDYIKSKGISKNLSHAD
jgi:AraC-like DNA-binding protein